MFDNAEARALSSDPLRRGARRAQAVPSVGSHGDSHDNVMSEALNSPFKAGMRNPMTRPKGGWKSVIDIGIALRPMADVIGPEHCGR